MNDKSENMFFPVKDMGMMAVIAAVCNKIAHEANRRYTDTQTEYLDRQSIKLADLKQKTKDAEQRTKDAEAKIRDLKEKAAWRSGTVNPEVFTGKRKRGRGRPSKPKLVLLRVA